MSGSFNYGIWVPLEEGIEVYQKSQRNTWIITKSGKHVDFSNIREEDVDFSDIVTGLSNACRFAGQCGLFYSVAEHSVLVSKVVEWRTGDIHLAQAALLHDAQEAYMGDLPTPLKNLCPGFKIIEQKFERVIEKRFNLKCGFRDAAIKQADLLLYYIESRHFFGDAVSDWKKAKSAIDALDIKPECLPPMDAATAFRLRAEELGIECVS